jgi:DNA modification methylase
MNRKIPTVLRDLKDLKDLELNSIYCTDALSGLKRLDDDSVDCCVSSPPYYGLRDYRTATWTGGDPDCRHSDREEKGFANSLQASNRGNSKKLPKNICTKCGAVRIDRQIGLEETPEAYIARLVEVFMEVYRVLKPEGTLWLNIGDSYWGGKGYSGSSAGEYRYQRRKEGKSITPACSSFGGKGTVRPTDRKHAEIKPKDLIGIPWMLAFALRKAGWYLRQDIIWRKPNPMPESVKDRCTKAHEYIFLLTKSAKYRFDYKAIQEPAIYTEGVRKAGDSKYTAEATGLKQEGFRRKDTPYPEYKDRRDVWTVCSSPGKESHFAVFPEKLIVDCIKAGCPENGLVLDPFMGSGTTAVVARKLNRNYIGFELNPEYVEISNRKLYKELGMWL